MFHDPTFWVATAFVAFIALLVYLKVPGKVGEALDKRSEKIKADLDEAEALRNEAQDLLATYQKKQRDAAAEAKEIVDQVTAEAERIVSSGRERLDTMLERREKLVIERLRQAENAAIDRVRDMTIDIAVEAARDVITARAATDTAADAMIDASIQELSKNLH